MVLINIFLTAAALSAAPMQVGAQAASKPSGFKLYDTTWTFVDHGTKVQESIDRNGNYIENAITGKHIDHGTASMRGEKACFTSAMNKTGEVCWTVQPVNVGQSIVAISDKGEKLTVTRIEYIHMSMPK